MKYGDKNKMVGVILDLCMYLKTILVSLYM